MYGVEKCKDSRGWGGAAIGRILALARELSKSHLERIGERKDKKSK